MKKIQAHIEIVRSTIINLSSLSTESCDAIYETLSRNYTTVGVSTVNNLADLERLVAIQPDLVFLGMKYIWEPTGGSHLSQKIWLSEYLDRYGVAYTGSPKYAHMMERHKPSAKQCVREAGLNTPNYTVITSSDSIREVAKNLRYPLFVKPASLGGGAGIDTQSVVHNLSELNTKINLLRMKTSTDTLIEEFMPGREFSVAVLQNEYSDQLMIMPIELMAEPNEYGDRVLTLEVKTSNQESVHSVLPGIVRDKVISFAKSCFLALGARDYGRIDIRLDSNGKPNFLEANLIPSLIDGYGSFPKACALNMSMTHETMLLNIANLGLSRSRLYVQQDSELSNSIFNSVAEIEPVTL